ncbi:hypothetical protein DAI22_02g060100 [Oryza sativa Japonica Group]|nr:hypothetical protein DAI22_02g060100 [Oryza sativa Japonica Group]
MRATARRIATVAAAGRRLVLRRRAVAVAVAIQGGAAAPPRQLGLPASADRREDAGQLNAVADALGDEVAVDLADDVVHDGGVHRGDVVAVLLLSHGGDRRAPTCLSPPPQHKRIQISVAWFSFLISSPSDRLSPAIVC